MQPCLEISAQRGDAVVWEEWGAQLMGWKPMTRALPSGPLMMPTLGLMAGSDLWLPISF